MFLIAFKHRPVLFDGWAAAVQPMMSRAAGVLHLLADLKPPAQWGFFIQTLT